MNALIGALRPFGDLRDDQLNELAIGLALRMGVSSLAVSILPQGTLRRIGHAYVMAVSSALVMVVSESLIRYYFEKEIEASTAHKK